MAAALVALAALFAPGAQPAQAQSTTVWSATLTVADIDGGIFFGCSDGGVATSFCNLTSVLTDDDFTYAGAGYDVLLVAVAGGGLEFVPGTALPADLISHGILDVDGTQFLLSAATLSSGKNFRWPSSGLSWAAGDTVELRLTALSPLADCPLSDLTLRLRVQQRDEVLRRAGPPGRERRGSVHQLAGRCASGPTAAYRDVEVTITATTKDSDHYIIILGLVVEEDGKQVLEMQNR